MLVLEELQVGNLVASESVDDLILGQEVADLGGGLLEVLQLLNNLLSLLVVLLGSILDTVELAVQSRDVIGHVCVL